ncbi:MULTISPECIES: type II toxin-antitoxin system RelE/ParE family toxin [unclassified Thiocapsa]|uniref:type II toxin-antitoxin system RelE/ParE family toxin n=1 Tax=unclassified Thiocapsa TaxID=2641286 RepID=UPI0035B44D41
MVFRRRPEGRRILYQRFRDKKGRALAGGDYRILCELCDDELIVLVVTIGHRRQIYRKP